MLPASRVANHDSTVWLRTGVSSGNWPMFGTKMKKIPLAFWRVPAWTEYLEECCSGAVWGKSGNLGDRPADKISVCSDQGPEIRRICRLGHRDCCVPLFMDCFLMPSYCTPLLGPCLISSIK